MTEASFVLVSRDPLNVGSAFVNPLIAETDQEKMLIQLGNENKRNRYYNQPSMPVVPSHVSGDHNCSTKIKYIDSSSHVPVSTVV